MLVEPGWLDDWRPRAAERAAVHVDQQRTAAAGGVADQPPLEPEPVAGGEFQAFGRPDLRRRQRARQFAAAPRAQVLHDDPLAAVLRRGDVGEAVAAPADAHGADRLIRRSGDRVDAVLAPRRRPVRAHAAAVPGTEDHPGTVAEDGGAAGDNPPVEAARQPAHPTAID